MPLRRRLAAAFVVFHVLSVVVLSVPRPPPGLRHAERRVPQTDAMVAQWAAGAERLGLAEDRVVELVHRWLPVWNRLLGAVRAPFEPYGWLTGARQSWLMFGSVPAVTCRLEIDVGADGAWTPLYRPLSGEIDWNARLLRQERMRAELARYCRRGHRAGFVGLADRLAEGAGPVVPIGRSPRPAGDRLRLRVRTLRIPDPERLAAEGALIEGPVFWTLERPLP